MEKDLWGSVPHTQTVDSPITQTSDTIIQQYQYDVNMMFKLLHMFSDHVTFRFERR